MSRACGPFHSDHTRGEPDAGRCSTPRLEPREPTLTTGSLARPRSSPVRQSPRNTVQAGVERLLAAFSPPWRHLELGHVPCSPQGGKTPPEARRQVLAIHTVGAFRRSLAEIRLHRLERPVECEPCRTGMTFQISGLRWSRVQREPIPLHGQGRHRRDPSGGIRQSDASDRLYDSRSLPKRLAEMTTPMATMAAKYARWPSIERSTNPVHRPRMISMAW